MRYLPAPKPGSIVDRFFERPVKRVFEITGVLAMGALALWAVDYTVDTVLSHESDKILPSGQVADVEPVIEYSADGWSIECFGPTSIHEVEPGDTLSGFIQKEVRVFSSAAIGSSEIPLEVTLGAIADMNGLNSPDQIQIGDRLTLPEECEIAL